MKNRNERQRRDKQDFEELDMDFEEDMEEQESYFDMEETAEDDRWEEPKPLPFWAMLLIFLGMALLAALLCALLWRFTHLDKGDGNGQNTRPEETSISEILQEPTQAPTAEPETEPTVGQAAEPTPESTAAPTADPTSEPTVTPTAEPEPTPTPRADAEEQTQEPVAGNKNMSFSDVQESVTPKDVVNLRSVPTTQDEENIVTQVRNGEELSRTGINSNTGWSRIDYNGQTLYAVSQYLTTDLDYKPPVSPTDPNRVSTISGRIIIFANCDDWISPKEYVNLRTEPSTTEGDATVSCQLNYGEKAHRTGYSTDSGWSRVEYNGQILYVVTSLMYEVTE